MSETEKSPKDMSNLEIQNCSCEQCSPKRVVLDPWASLMGRMKK